jgi:hypothetical protein
MTRYFVQKSPDDKPMLVLVEDADNKTGVTVGGESSELTPEEWLTAAESLEQDLPYDDFLKKLGPNDVNKPS